MSGFLKPVNAKVNIVAEEVGQHTNAPGLTAKLCADAALLQFTANLAQPEVLEGAFVNQSYDFRFFRFWNVLASIIGPVPKHVRTTGLSAQLRLTDPAAIHITQQLPAEMFGQHTFEIEHQDGVIFAQIENTRIHHQQCVGGFQGLGDQRQVTQIFRPREPVRFFDPEHIDVGFTVTIEIPCRLERRSANRLHCLESRQAHFRLTLLRFR
jgi:hypothetical protein